MADDRDDIFDSGPTTRLGFLTMFGRRAAQALPDVPDTLVAREPRQASLDEDVFFDEEPPDHVEPFLSGDELVEEIRASLTETGVHAWWLGQGGVVVAIGGSTVLVDPYLSNTLAEQHGATDVTYERITPVPVAPELLSFVDVVVCTNTRPDHLDAGTLPAVLSGGAAFVCASGSRSIATARAGRAPDHLLARDSMIDLGSISLYGVPTYDADAPESIGLAVRSGAYGVYVAGDTRRVQGIAEEVACHGVDIAMLPINGNGNMDGADAARLAFESLAPIAVPCHYDMFRHDTVSPSRFVAECVRIGQEYRLPRCGERISVDHGY